MTVSVIIPVYRDWVRLALCLDALGHQSISEDQFEVIVVNNDPSDIHSVELKGPKNLRILSERRAGSYAARNKGINAAKGEIIAFTDSDCIPDIDWLNNAVKYFGREHLLLLGGRIEMFKPEGGDHLPYLFEKQYAFWQKRNILKNHCSVTANLFVSRGVLANIGEFNEALMSGGDFELTKRATSYGYRLIYGENVLVRHPARRSVHQLVSKRKRTIGGLYQSEYRNWSLRRKTRYHFYSFFSPIVVFLKSREMSVLQGVAVLFLKWGIELAALIELVKLSTMGKAPDR